jgi:hypothetical protein
VASPEIQLGKYMIARLLETKPKTAVYGIFSKHHGDRLGTVKWFGPWRQYCFFCTDVSVFSSTCFQALQKFIDGLNTVKKAVS